MCPVFKWGFWRETDSSHTMCLLMSDLGRFKEEKRRKTTVKKGSEVDVKQEWTVDSSIQVNFRHHGLFSPQKPECCERETLSARTQLCMDGENSNLNCFTVSYFCIRESCVGLRSWDIFRNDKMNAASNNKGLIHNGKVLNCEVNDSWLRLQTGLPANGWQEATCLFSFSTNQIIIKVEKSLKFTRCIQKLFGRFFLFSRTKPLWNNGRGKPSDLLEKQRHRFLLCPFWLSSICQSFPFLLWDE